MTYAYKKENQKFNQKCHFELVKKKKTFLILFKAKLILPNNSRISSV